MTFYSHCPITRVQGSTVHYLFMLLDDLKQDLKLNEEMGGRLKPAIGKLIGLANPPRLTYLTRMFKESCHMIFQRNMLMH